MRKGLVPTKCFRDQALLSQTIFENEICSSSKFHCKISLSNLLPLLLIFVYRCKMTFLYRQTKFQSRGNKIDEEILRNLKLKFWDWANLSFKNGSWKPPKNCPRLADAINTSADLGQHCLSGVYTSRLTCVVLNSTFICTWYRKNYLHFSLCSNVKSTQKCRRQLKNLRQNNSPTFKKKQENFKILTLYRRTRPLFASKFI